MVPLGKTVFGQNQTNGNYDGGLGSSLRNDLAKPFLPRVDRRAHFVHVAVALIDADDAAETARDVVEKLLRHLETDAECGEVGREGAAQDRGASKT